MRQFSLEFGIGILCIAMQGQKNINYSKYEHVILEYVAPRSLVTDTLFQLSFNFSKKEMTSKVWIGFWATLSFDIIFAPRLTSFSFNLRAYWSFFNSYTSIPPLLETILYFYIDATNRVCMIFLSSAVLFFRLLWKKLIVILTCYWSSVKIRIVRTWFFFLIIVSLSAKKKNYRMIREFAICSIIHTSGKKYMRFFGKTINLYVLFF